MISSTNDWFATRVRAGREKQVLAWLERKGMEGRVLWQRKLIRHNRTKKLSWRAFRLAPGYVFVQLRTIGMAGVVRQCEDVVCFVGVRNRPPRSIGVNEVGDMLAIEANEEFEAFVEPAPDRPVFKRNDEVIVLDGLLAGARALVVSVNGGRLASIEILSGLGSQSSISRPVSIAIDMLEKAG